MPFLNFDGNQFPIKQAIGWIEQGEIDLAAQVLSQALREIQPGATVTGVHYKGGQPSVRVHSHPDLEKYRQLDVAITRARRALQDDPEDAKQQLQAILERNGWVTAEPRRRPGPDA